MNKALHNLFSFTYRERNAILFLLAIVFILTLVKLWIILHDPGEEEYDDREIVSRLETFEKQALMQESKNHISSAFLAEELFETYDMFYFDPNTADRDELARLGMNERVIRILLNYRNKGGRFYTCEDLKKIYGMTATEYARLEPYIRIDQASYEDKHLHSAVLDSDQHIHSLLDAKGSDDSKSKELYRRIELNKADTSELMRLKGIGPILAQRIVKYRELLGGYCKSKQLKEVYGISDSLFNALEQFVYADTSGIQTINTNTASKQQLSRHPYLGNFYAEGIILYREHSKKISGIEELIKNELIPEDRQEIIGYYLEF